jgi:hypothetical protein
MRLAVAGIALVLGAGWAGAGEHLEIRAAQMELKLAQRHLQDAARSHEGHRRAALEQTNLALREVTQALLEARREDGGGTATKAPPAEDED